MEKITFMGIAGVIGTVVLVASNVICLLILKTGLEGFFLSTILSNALPALFLAIAINFRKLIHNTVYEKKLKNSMVAYSFPLVFSTISWWINSASDRYVVTFLCGVAQNGILSVAYKIPSIVNTVFGMFGQAWQISAIKEFDKDDSKRFYENVITLTNTLTILFCSLLIALSKPIGSILYANEFFEAWKYAPFLIVSCIFNNASGLLGPVLSAIKDTKSMAKSAVYGAVVNVVLNILLVYLIGTQGATIATVISAAVIYFGRKIAVDKVIKLKINFELITSAILLIAEAVNVIYLESAAISAGLIIFVFAVNFRVIKHIASSLPGIVKGHRRNA